MNLVIREKRARGSGQFFETMLLRNTKKLRYKQTVTLAHSYELQKGNIK